jgi:hypothetical protein
MDEPEFSALHNLFCLNVYANFDSTLLKLRQKRKELNICSI